MQIDRPKFLPAYFDLLRGEVDRSGWRALVPYVLLTCLALGGAVACLIPALFWDEDHWGVSITVFIGILTLNGLILALGWNAFGRVYDTLFRGEFGAYLIEKKLLNDYLIHISVMHWSQVAAVVMSGCALISVLIESTPEWGQRALFALMVATTIYGIKQAVDAVRTMNDLVWQAAAFETLNRRKKEGAAAFNMVQGGKS